MAHPHRFLAICLALSLPLLLWVWPYTQLDAVLIAPYFSVATKFYLRRDDFLSSVMHDGLRHAMETIALLTLLLGLLSYQIKSLTTWGRLLLWAFCGMVLSVSTIMLLKHFSTLSCPWDLPQYGALNADTGGCFPAAHAASGFALSAFYFAFKEIHHKFAYFMLALGLGLGWTMGWAQMMRGAHFMSHTLWSCWVTLFLQMSLNQIWPPKHTLT